MFGAQCLLLSCYFLAICPPRNSVFGFWYRMVLDRCLVLCTRLSVLSVRSSIFSIRYSALSTRCSLPGTQYPSVRSSSPPVGCGSRLPGSAAGVPSGRYEVPADVSEWAWSLMTGRADTGAGRRLEEGRQGVSVPPDRSRLRCADDSSARSVRF